jgi:hypothetical protein
VLEKRRYLSDAALPILMFSALAATHLAGCANSDRPSMNTGGSSGMGNVAGSSQTSFDAECFEPQSVQACVELFPHEADVAPVQIAAAADVGTGAHFTALGGWAVLAELPDGQPPRIVMADVQSASRIFDIDRTDAAGELDVVSVWGEAESYISEALPTPVVALGCNGAGCQLLAVSEGDQVLRALPEFALDPSWQVTTLAGGGGKLCAFGEGLYCLDGSEWIEALPAAITGQISRVTLGAAAAIVTLGGRLFVESDAGEWLEQPATFDSPVDLERYNQTVSLLADDGAWSVVSLAPAGIAKCEQAPRLLLALPGAGQLGLPWLVTDESGTTFGQRQLYLAPNQPAPGLTWCRVSSGVSETLLGATAVRCADGMNLLAITDDRLWSLLGRIVCPII